MNVVRAEAQNHVVALIHSHQALEANPEDAVAYFEQGIALCQLGQWEQAVESWEQVIRLEPDNVAAHINIGFVHLEQGEWETAQTTFAQAVACRTDNAEAHYGLGLAYVQQEQYARARSAWEEALRLQPGHAQAQANLASLPDPEPEPAQTHTPRIKMPDLDGPPMGEVAEMVMTAHNVQAVVNASMVVDQASSPRRMVGSSPRARFVVAGVAIGIAVGLIVSGWRGGTRVSTGSAGFTAANTSPILNRPSTSALSPSISPASEKTSSLLAGPVQTAPAREHASSLVSATAHPEISTKVSAAVASLRTHTSRLAHTFAENHSEDHDSARRDVHRVNKERAENVARDGEKQKSEMVKPQIAAVRSKPSAKTSGHTHGSQDEDTFPTHVVAAHAADAADWSDVSSD